MIHEIMTPLNGVIGFSQILESMDLKPKEKSFVSKIRQSGETLLTTINDILSLSKIEAGKIDLEYRSFDLARTIETSIEILSPKAEEKDIGLEADTRSLPDAIVGDETRVRQIILNLVGNAVKFTEKGGVTVVATYQNDFVVIRVKDSGIGISEENQKKLFQPFSQADSSTTRKYGGTGLGLVICRKLAQLMGGSIELESREGAGSTFTLKFPAKKGETPQERPVAFTEQEDLLPLSILVAEDDEVNRLVIFEMLKGLGHEVEFAKNGKEALEKAKELRLWADVILMDMRMPEMDGLEATRAIRSYERDNNLKAMPIFALTANAMEEDKNRCMESGMTNYVSKPIDISILKKALAQCQKAKRSAIKGTSEEKSVKANDPTPKTSPNITHASNKESHAPEDSRKTPVEKKETERAETLESNLGKENEFETFSDFGGFELSENPLEDIEDKKDKDIDLGTRMDTKAKEEGKPEAVGNVEIEEKAESHSEDIIESSQSDDLFGEWGFGDKTINIFEEENLENGEKDDLFPRVRDKIGKDTYDEDIISPETLNACLEILPIERVASIILPSIEENCRKGVQIILSKESSPKEKANAAHKMCGSLGTFGCTALERAARGIESNYERTSSPSHEEEELESLVEKTLETLRKTIDKKLKS
jgi:CheY-like chemotaxis protein